MQRRLRQWCRAIYYSCTFSLVMFIIYVNVTSSGTQRHGAPPRKVKIDVSRPVPVPFRAACSSNMFATRDGCMPCPRGTFSFPGWSECTPWLNCSEIALQVHPTRRFHHGITKLVWHADWQSYHVVFINCSAQDPVKREHCSKGLSIMEQIQGKFATRLIGMCPDKLQVSHDNRRIFHLYRNTSSRGLCHAIFVYFRKLLWCLRIS